MDKLLETEKTMAHWFMENGINMISVDVPYSSESSLIGVYAVIEEDKSTKEPAIAFKAWDEDGGQWNTDCEDVSSADGEVFAKNVTKLLEVLRKPYPTNDK